MGADQPQEKDGRWRTIKKNGLGVLTGPINGGLLAVDIDGEDAESVFAEFMGDDYPNVDDPGTMSWRGKPTNRQLLYRVPEGLQHFFLELTKAQLDKELAKGKTPRSAFAMAGATASCLAASTPMQSLSGAVPDTSGSTKTVAK